MLKCFLLDDEADYDANDDIGNELLFVHYSRFCTGMKCPFCLGIKQLSTSFAQISGKASTFSG